jgi:hypothetical protein
MKRWVSPAARGRVLVLALCVAACGGHGPTAPASPLPQIAGTWNGSWGSGFFAFTSMMKLVQADDGTVQGTLYIFPNTVDIEGTVSAATPASFSFHSIGNCPTTGTLALTEQAGLVTQMSGSTSQDFRPCGFPNARPTVGTLLLTR